MVSLHPDECQMNEQKLQVPKHKETRHSPLALNNNNKNGSLVWNNKGIILTNVSFFWTREAGAYNFQMVGLTQVACTCQCTITTSTTMTTTRVLRRHLVWELSETCKPSHPTFPVWGSGYSHTPLRVIQRHGRYVPLVTPSLVAYGYLHDLVGLPYFY